MHAIESIHAQLEAAAHAIESRVQRIEDALHVLASLTRTLRASVPVDAASLAAFLAEGDLAPDATGFFERRSLLARIRAGGDVRRETSWFWPSTRKDDARVAARLAPLRHLGPTLLTLRERLGEVAWIYYQDALNVALVHPALDMITAVPPTFEWSTYHSVASVAVEVNPTREIRWTPPSIDYGGAGLITSASIPVDDDEVEPGDGARREGAATWRGGVWSIDVPLRTLHADVQLAGDDRLETFIVDGGGELVAHPSVEALTQREKGSLCRVRLAALGGGFESLDVAGLAEGGEKEIVDAVGVRRLICAKRVRGIHGFLVASVPVERLASAVTKSFEAAFERVRGGELSFRMGTASSAQVRDLAETFDRMVEALEENRRERDLAEQERQRLASQLAHATKMQAIGQLAGGIAHDFNNFLTAVLTAAHSLSARDLLARDQELVRIILDAGERAGALSGQLLAFSRRQVLDPRPIDPGLTLERARPLLARVAGERVRLELRIEREHGAILLDEGHLIQIALNLVINARDAMPQGGALRIEVSRGEDPREVLVRFADEGEGMTEETRQHVFEPLYTTKAGGTGLGLTTVRSIVEDARGRIEVTSARGVGTRFDLVFPRERRVSVLPPPKARRRPARGESILVVDDEPLVREATILCLQELGYDVTGAASAEEARAEARRRGSELSLLITDLVMPRIGGVELADRVRQTCPRTRVLFVSGYADDEHRPSPRPGTAFLAKPFNPEELGRKVRELLDG